MRVLESRITPDGWRRRRYESATGVRHTTIEVPMELWQRINTVGRQRDRAAQVQRTLDRQSAMRQARALAEAGRSTREISKALGVSYRTATRWINGR